MNTVVAPLLDAKLLGYPYVCFVDEAVQADIVKIQRRFSEVLPGQLWLPGPKSLHVTYLHLLSPDVAYNEPVEQLYRENADRADEAMRQVAEEFGSFRINCGEVVVSPAAIIVKWDDGGQMDRMREALTSRFKLPEFTKNAPNIVHTTIARFLKPMPLAPVQDLARKLQVIAMPMISEIDLVRETRIYLQEFEVVERYPLKG